jgi:hypothetical protein
MTEPEPGRTALAEALHRAAGDVAPPALPGDLWSRGRRERRRRAVRRVGAVVAAVVAAAVGLPTLGVVAPPVIGPAATRVSGYPMRINHQWVVRDLPDRPGPLAALVQTVRHRSSYDEAGPWLAVAPDGHYWRVPELGNEMYPVLSDDGRYLAYLADDTRRLLIRDLVRGSSRRLPDVGDTLEGLGPLAPYRVGFQQPGRFSPDGSKLLFAATDFVIDSRDGGIIPLRLGADTGIPIGWDGNDALWTLSSKDRYPTGDTMDVASLFSVPLAGGPARRTYALQRRQGLPSSWFSQWSGPVSPDGRRLVLAPGSTTDPVAEFDLLTGAATTFTPPGQTITCPAAWDGDRPVLPLYRADRRSQAGGDYVETMRFGSAPDGPAKTLAVTSPRIRATCVIWAADALAAGPTGWHPFGTSTSRWTWYWPELTLAALLAALAAGALVIRRRTRRRRIS